MRPIPVRLAMISEQQEPTAPESQAPHTVSQPVAQDHSTPLAELLTELFHALPAGGVPFIILRNYEDLPHSTSNDVDFLIAPDNLIQAEVILADVACRCGWRIHNRARFSPVSIFLHHQESKTQVQIDYFTRLEWRGIELISITEAFKHQKRFRDIPIPHPAHEAFLNITGRLLPYGLIRDKYQSQIQRASAAEGDVLEHTATLVFGADHGKMLRNASAAGDWSRLESAYRVLRRSAVLNRPLHALRGWAGMAVRLSKRFFRPPGMWMVFLGPDGSGKSTCLSRCAGLLETTFSPGKSRHIHWKPVPFRKPSLTPGAANTNPHGKPARPLPLSLLYLCWHWCQFLLGHWTVVKPILFRNGAVYFDRHYADFLVDPKRFRLRVPRPILRVLGRLLPQPDLILINHAPAEVLLARKAEVPPDECRRQTEAYAGLVHELPNTRLIDATREPEEVAREAESEVLEFLTRRTLARYPHLAPACPAPPADAPPSPRLRVLLSAYACEPGRGSEPGVGWEWATRLCDYHDVTVITRANNQDVIEKELKSHETGSPPSFLYVDLPAWIVTLKRRGLVPTFAYYLLWQIAARRAACRSGMRFDIIHHVTFNGFRFPGVWWNQRVPVVLGPLGGGSIAHECYRRCFGNRWWLEKLREASIHFWNWNPWTLISLKEASAVFVVGEEMQYRLQTSGIQSASMLETALPRELEKDRPEVISPTREHFVWVGNLEPWKAWQIALEAFAEAVRRGIGDQRLRIVGSGSQKESAFRMAEELEIADRVDFVGQLPRSEVWQMMETSRALVFSSVRDTSGNVVLEAMGMRCPVICFKHQGVALMTDDGCAFRIQPGNWQDSVEGFSSAMFDLANSNDLVEQMGREGRNRALRKFTWKAKVNDMLEVYSMLTKDR